MVCFISSVVDRQKLNEFDIIIESTNPSFPTTGLKLTSIVKSDKIATLDRSILLGELGEVDAEMMSLVDQKLRMLFGL